MLRFLECCDFYKPPHRVMMPTNTTRILENFTPRSGRETGYTGSVFFGLQGHLYYDLGKLANETFFNQPKWWILDEHKQLMDEGLGPDNCVGVEHISALYDLGYLPLEYRALPEGTLVPYKVPMFTVENTHEDFAWLGGYLESLTSSRVWQPCTTATKALKYRQLCDYYCGLTGGDPDLVDWLVADFSFRGMGAPEAAAFSGGGHLLSFKATDNRPAIRVLKDAYDGGRDVGGSIPATEHMVMCLGGKATEEQTYERLLDLFPKGPLGQVSDTWDLWNVATVILPKLREKIMARDGKLVIRPDSGHPLLILCGDSDKPLAHPARTGLIRLLADCFGTHYNRVGFKELNPKIGAIYGEKIKLSLARDIYHKLFNMGFASSNAVLGVGSYEYQYVTRDTHGFAIKATWAIISGEEVKLFKDPITDDGTKKSATGRMVVVNNCGKLELIDNLNLWQERKYLNNLLRPVWRDGRFLLRNTLADMRKRLRDENS